MSKSQHFPPFHLSMPDKPSLKGGRGAPSEPPLGGGDDLRQPIDNPGGAGGDLIPPEGPGSGGMGG